jgi:hypothetical protein
MQEMKQGHLVAFRSFWGISIAVSQGVDGPIMKNRRQGGGESCRAALAQNNKARSVRLKSGRNLRRRKQIAESRLSRTFGLITAALRSASGFGFQVHVAGSLQLLRRIGVVQKCRYVDAQCTCSPDFTCALGNHVGSAAPRSFGA